MFNKLDTGVLQETMIDCLEKDVFIDAVRAYQAAKSSATKKAAKVALANYDDALRKTSRPI